MSNIVKPMMITLEVISVAMFCANSLESGTYKSLERKNAR
jgi:hypothetical protein